MNRPLLRIQILMTCAALLVARADAVAAPAPDHPFVIEETTIARIHEAILAKRLTATELVHLYLARIKAYNGPGVAEPVDVLGPSTFLAHAPGINALCTLNLRPPVRRAWGFDDRKARSLTDLGDDDPAMPDALETAAALDAHFAKTGQLIGPLHGVVMAIKDQYDTFDLRTTSGTDAFYANDRPPQDAEFVARLRAAGAIILAKANTAEDASGAPRSAFGGTFLNPYDTTRSPGGSSSGSGSSVGANLVTCAIAEETNSSIRSPAHWASAVGLSGTQELVSRHGMMGLGTNTRTGPITRTVEDAARILTVIAGYDPKDPMTAFARGRTPDEPYEHFTREKRLDGLRIGVVREYMDRTRFSVADEQSITLVEEAIAELRRLGATVIDPGPTGELFTKNIRAQLPRLHNIVFTQWFPELFPVDAAGKPAADHIATLVDMTLDPSLIPEPFTLRELGSYGGSSGSNSTPGEARFEKSVYWRQRGDANITSLADRVAKARYYTDPAFPDRRTPQVNADRARAYDTTVRHQRRFAVQQMILTTFAELDLDAVVYPTGNLPPTKLGAPSEPRVNGRSTLWTLLGTQGFSAISVPCGFTTEVYDRAPNPDGGTPLLVGPIPAELPVGVDFLGPPYSEPVLLRIAAAYENATKLRRPPPDFPALPTRAVAAASR